MRTPFAVGGDTQPVINLLVNIYFAIIKSSCLDVQHASHTERMLYCSWTRTERAECNIRRVSKEKAVDGYKGAVAMYPCSARVATRSMSSTAGTLTRDWIGARSPGSHSQEGSWGSSHVQTRGMRRRAQAVDIELVRLVGQRRSIVLFDG